MRNVVFEVRLTNENGEFIDSVRVSVPFKRGHVEAAVRKAQGRRKLFAESCVKIADYEEYPVGADKCK
jgi:hypothetical protein